MTQAHLIAALLGGPKVLGRPVQEDADLVDVLRIGIPATAVRELAGKSNSSVIKLVDLMGLNKRTLERRVTEKARLKTLESNGMVRFARVLALAINTLGDPRGVEWLHRSNRALGGRTPFSMLDTDIGARQVEDVLGRIEHGVFS